MPPSESAYAVWWRKHWQDALLGGAILALSVFVRWISLQTIEDGGDPLDNWFFVRQWHYETDLATTRIDHHAARMGIHWLTFLVQRLLGPEPQYYFVPSFIIANLTALLTYTLGRQTAGKTVGVIAALLVITNGMLGEAANQLRRGIFECFYVLLALNCLARYVATEGTTRRRWLVAGALAVFMGYLTEVPLLFVMPGILFVLWRASGGLRDPLLYSAILVGLFLAETAVYALFTAYWNRLNVIFSFHLGRPIVERKIGYLFARFTDADASLKLAFYPFFLAAPLLLALRRNVKTWIVVLPTASFLFLMTFLVRSINPLVTFMQNNDRYLVLGMAPAFVASTTALVEGARFGLRELGKRLPAEPLARFAAARVPALTAAALIVIGVVGVKSWQRYGRRQSPFAELRSDSSLLNDAYARGLPIIAKVTSRKRGLARARSLHWVYKGFLKDELLLEQGGLPSFSYSNVPKVLSTHEHYLAKRELPPERIRELRAEGCTVEASSGGVGVELRPRADKLPARCKP